MEREREGFELKKQTGFREELKIALSVMSVFLWGIKIAAITGVVVYGLSLSYPVKTSQLIFLVVASVFILTMLVFDLIRMIMGQFLKDSTTTKETFILFSVGGCLFVLNFLHTLNWAPIVIGAVFAVCFWGHMNPYGRPYPFIAAASILSGLIVQRAPLSFRREILLGRVSSVLFGMSIAATIQGGWIIFCYLREHWPTKSTETAGAPNGFVRLH